jgi:hypothetical protein
MIEGRFSIIMTTTVSIGAAPAGRSRMLPPFNLVASASEAKLPSAPAAPRAAVERKKSRRFSMVVLRWTTQDHPGRRGDARATLRWPVFRRKSMRIWVVTEGVEPDPAWRMAGRGFRSGV